MNNRLNRFLSLFAWTLLISNSVSGKILPIGWYTHPIDSFPGGYKIVPSDMDNDGRIDLVCLSTSPSRLAWYENPGWKKHAISTVLDRFIDAAPGDMDDDGLPELVAASSFRMQDTRSGGRIDALYQRKGLEDWTVFPVHAEPTAHRLAWIDLDGDGRIELMVAPVMGRNAEPPLWDKPVRLLWFDIPANPFLDPWPMHIADSTLTVLHGFCIVDWDGDGTEDILTASFEGICLFRPDARQGLRHWEKQRIAEGDQKNPAKRGSSEVSVGTFGMGSERWIAAIEPWHGNKTVVYCPSGDGRSRWIRTVLDTTLDEGHALRCADVDGDGDDEIIAGFRGNVHGLVLYKCSDRKKYLWDRTEIDLSDKVSGIAVSDLNADGRPDIAAIGETARWYENVASKSGDANK